MAAFSVYSYSKLGMKYPDRGGAAKFLLKEFGDGLLAGGMNVFQYIGWIITMALYATGFAEYACQLLGNQAQAGQVRQSVSELSSWLWQVILWVQSKWHVRKRQLLRLNC